MNSKHPPNDAGEGHSHEFDQFATELHDGLLQYLVAASMAAEVLKREWQQRCGDPPDKLDELSSLIQSGLKAGRRLLAGSLTIDFSSESPREHIERNCREATERSGVEFDCRVQLADELSETIASVICRLTGEAIENIVRHSGANKATVDVRCIDQQVEIVVSDDGKGFTPGEVAGDHFGLQGMRRRVESLDGQFEVVSQDGEGTRLVASFPSTVAD